MKCFFCKNVNGKKKNQKSNNSAYDAILAIINFKRMINGCVIFMFKNNKGNILLSFTSSD